jgi:hypothetical protein
MTEAETETHSEPQSHLQSESESEFQTKPESRFSLILSQRLTECHSETQSQYKYLCQSITQLRYQASGPTAAVSMLLLLSSDGVSVDLDVSLFFS